jgi:Na+/H+-dicarboxylate symporter
MFNAMEFFVLTFLILITIFSRMNVGCKTLLDAVYCTLIGLLFGVVFYNIVQPYYKADFLVDEITIANEDINNFFSLN